MAGPAMQCEAFEFTGKFESYRDRFPIGPHIFHDKVLTKEKFKSCLDNGYLEILEPMRQHVGLKLTSVETYLKDPGNFPSINKDIFRLPDKNVAAKKIKLDPDQSQGFSSTTGTYHLSKFGTEKYIWHYVNGASELQTKFMCLSLAKGTWNNYLSSIEQFLTFCDMIGESRTLPVDTPIICDFLCYLREFRNLTHESIKSHLSGIRKFYALNNFSRDYCYNQQIEICMDGIKNSSAVLKTTSVHRCVITWDHVKILGHALQQSDFDPIDQQTLWTLMLLGFFGTRRMGEVLSETVADPDTFRILTWNRVRALSDDHLVLILKLPKVSENPSGIVVDLIAFEELPQYCPVLNLKILGKMKLDAGLEVDNDDPIFMRKNGKLITQQFLNQVLESLLRPYFPDFAGKWTCHSFRAAMPASMATAPEKFNEIETKISGGWDSKAVDRYTRLIGEGRKKVAKKFHKFLRYFIL